MKIEEINNDYKFIAKEDSWYKPGTEVQLVTNCEWFGGVFKGIVHITKGSHTKHWDNMLENKNLNECELEDEELCMWEEFDIYSPSGELINLDIVD